MDCNESPSWGAVARGARLPSCGFVSGIVLGAQKGGVRWGVTEGSSDGEFQGKDIFLASGLSLPGASMKCVNQCKCRISRASEFGVVARPTH